MLPSVLCKEQAFSGLGINIVSPLETLTQLFSGGSILDEPPTIETLALSFPKFSFGPHLTHLIASPQKDVQIYCKQPLLPTTLPHTSVNPWSLTKRGACADTANSHQLGRVPRLPSIDVMKERLSFSWWNAKPVIRYISWGEAITTLVLENGPNNNIYGRRTTRGRAQARTY